ncbi:MarR family transcriptional regulator [Eisenbergiella massiliensis]
MTVKEYAANFDLTVNELCEVTGLSRQGLNDILVGDT